MTLEEFFELPETTLPRYELHEGNCTSWLSQPLTINI